MILFDKISNTWLLCRSTYRIQPGFSGTGKKKKHTHTTYELASLTTTTTGPNPHPQNRIDFLR